MCVCVCVCAVLGEGGGGGGWFIKERRCGFSFYFLQILAILFSHAILILTSMAPSLSCLHHQTTIELILTSSSTHGLGVAIFFEIKCSNFCCWYFTFFFSITNILCMIARLPLLFSMLCITIKTKPREMLSGVLYFINLSRLLLHFWAYCTLHLSPGKYSMWKRRCSSCHVCTYQSVRACCVS